MSSWWSGHKVLDSTDFEAWFSNEDSLAFMDIVIHDTVSEEGLARIEAIQQYLLNLPPREADFLDLYFFKHVKQTDIAAMYGVSQPTVCYRLSRAATRIRFMLALPIIDVVSMEKTLKDLLQDDIDVYVMVQMYHTTCQSAVAKGLKVSQGFVRHRFIRSLNKMRQVEEMTPYVLMFDMIAKNLNVLREVSRPAQDQKITHLMG